MAARMDIAKIVTPYRMQGQRHNAEEAEEKMLKKTQKEWKVQKDDRQTDGQAHKRQLLHVSEKESERVRETKTKGINETVLKIFPFLRTKYFGFLNALKLVKNTNCCQWNKLNFALYLFTAFSTLDLITID